MNKPLGKETKASKNTSSLSFFQGARKKQEKMVRQVHSRETPQAEHLAALVTFYLHVPAFGESKKKASIHRVIS